MGFFFFVFLFPLILSLFVFVTQHDSDPGSLGFVVTADDTRPAARWLSNPTMSIWTRFSPRPRVSLMRLRLRNGSEFLWSPSEFLVPMPVLLKSWTLAKQPSGDRYLEIVFALASVFLFVCPGVAARRVIPLKRYSGFKRFLCGHIWAVPSSFYSLFQCLTAVWVLCALISQTAQEENKWRTWGTFLTNDFIIIIPFFFFFSFVVTKRQRCVRAKF